MKALTAGDARPADAVFALVYAELHELARRALDGHGGAPTLQPTALVNEAYLRLVRQPADASWNGRAHFMGVAAKAMRCIVIDHARRRAALRRGGSSERLPLEELVEVFEAAGQRDLLELDDALERLGAQDPELAQLVELRFFAGETMESVAALLGVSRATAERRWTVARLWLQRELGTSPS